MSKVILNTYEVNGYDDSDFYAVILDREAGTVETKLYDSTRFASLGTNPLEGAETEATASDIELAKDILDKKSKASNAKLKEDALKNNIISVGDTCKVVKGIKFDKGLILLVTHFSEFKDPYCRVQCVYAHALVHGEEMRINEDNLKIVNQGQYYDALEADYSILTRS